MTPRTDALAVALVLMPAVERVPPDHLGRVLARVAETPDERETVALWLTAVAVELELEAAR